MQTLRNIFLYISAFIPMYFLILVNLIIEIINKNLSFNVLNTTMFITLTLFIILGVCGLVWTIKFNRDYVMEICVVKVQNTTDQHFLGYFSLFVLFALSFELEKVSMACVFVIILIFVGIVYIKNSLYYINPFLNILGYNFYDIEYKIKGTENIKTAKIFFKGNLSCGNYCVNLKNEHFAFISKRCH